LGRVPQHPIYSVIGSGRLARHLNFYLQNTGAQVERWSRNGDPYFNSKSQPNALDRLQATIKTSQFILLGVSDSAIFEVSIALKELIQPHQKLVHFSGAQQWPGIVALHPLMSFAPHIYESEFYPTIPFCEDAESYGAFFEIFPHWKNPVFSLTFEQRKLYHAYLVIAGNFSALLWRDVEQKFSQKLKLDSRLLRPYKQAVLNNILENSQAAVTGPIARGDHSTLQNNRDALHGDPLLPIYEAFQKTFSSRSEES
jgi:predicted short-subunit dehydrogenase-like oxidoreductase (DUF2520 family)